MDEGQLVEVPARLAKKRDESKGSQAELTTNLQSEDLTVSKPEVDDENLGPLSVASSADKSSQPELDSNEVLGVTDSDVGTLPPSSEELEQLDPKIREAVESPPRVPPVLQTRPWRQVKPLTEFEPSTEISAIRLEVDSSQGGEVDERSAAEGLAFQDSEEPAVEQHSNSESAETSSSDQVDVEELRISGIAALVETPPTINSGSVQVTSPGNLVGSSPPIIQLDSTPAEVDVPQKSWEERLADANADRKVLSRFFAGCLLILAMLNIVPPMYHWNTWSQVSQTIPLPPWIYLQIFAGAIFAAYAIFLMQVNDWSALRSVSIAMLVVAFIFGVVSTGLLVGTNVASALGVPFILNRQAAIWCVMMLLLATLMSYWAGKESNNWLRAEELLREIMIRQAEGNHVAPESNNSVAS